MDYPDPNQVVYQDESDDDGSETAVFQMPNQQVSFQPPASLIEAERRIAKANCYKALLHEPFFDNANAITQEVEREVRAFVQERFEDLLGMAKPKPSHDLTEDEVKVLKGFVETVKRRQSQPQSPQTAPVVAAPSPAQVQVPATPPGPTRRKAQTPKHTLAPVEAPQVSKPSTTKVRKRKAPVEDLQETAPAPQQQASPKPPPVARNNTNKEEVVATDQNGMRTIRRGHKLFKEMVAPDGSVRMLDVTQQARPGAGGPQPIPNLPANAQGAVMMQKAAEQVGRSVSIIETNDKR